MPSISNSDGRRRFYSDSERAKDALLPMLFRCLITMYLSHNPDLEDDLTPKIEILNAEIERAFRGHKKKAQLERRVVRTCKRMDTYFKREDFDSRKCYLTLMGWVESLVREERRLRIEMPGIKVVKIGHDFRLLLKAMYRIILQGYKQIDNFDKIDGSALNHVNELHKIAVEDGYF